MKGPLAIPLSIFLADRLVIYQEDVDILLTYHPYFVLLRYRVNQNVNANVHNFYVLNIACHGVSIRSKDEAKQIHFYVTVKHHSPDLVINRV